MAKIEFKDISFSIGGKTVIQNFSYTIESGDKVIFSGPSGSGKTSLINMVIGYVQPTDGMVYVDGLEMSSKNKNDIRKNISYISQDADLSNIKVKSFIDEVYNYKINSEIEINNDRIMDLLQKFQLETETLDKMIGDLSGGERVRLAYIISKLLDRDILLFDEITASLDEKLKKIIIKDVLESDKTALVISHDRHWQKSKKIKQIRW